MFKLPKIITKIGARNHTIYRPFTNKPVQAIQSARLITAIKTPFLPNGKIDLKSFDYHASQQVKHGVDGLIIGGTTGEGHLLSWDEHIMLIAHAKYTLGDRCIIIGNTGSNSTQEALRATEQGFSVGMDASLQINPYYGKTSENGLLKHFSQLMDFGPAIIYNVPGRTSQDISVEIIEKLSNHENFTGVKECMGNSRIQQYTDKGIFTWSGNDDECHDARHNHGCNGVISVTSNIIPGLFRKMMDTPNPSINKKIEKLIQILFIYPNPIGINTVMMILGLCKPVFRLPYVELEPELRNEAINIINEIGIEHFVKNKNFYNYLDDKDFIYI